MTHSFSIKEAIVFGWHKLKARSGLVFGVVLTMFVLEVVSSMVQKTLQHTLLGAAASIVLAIAGVFIGAGMTLIFLRLARGEHTQYADIIPDIKLVWKYFCASVLTGFIAFLPLMAGGLVSFALLASTGSINFSLGAPVAGHMLEFALAGVIVAVAAGFAVYLALRYSMARLLVLDGSDIVESLRKSTKLTRGVMWHLALFALAIIGLNLLGVLAAIVGLLVSIPVSILAFVHVYIKLKSHHGHH